MPDGLIAGLARSVQLLQGGLAMDVIQTPVHDTPDQTFEGMQLGCSAADAGGRHGALLHHGLTFFSKPFPGRVFQKRKKYIYLSNLITSAPTRTLTASAGQLASRIQR